MKLFSFALTLLLTGLMCASTRAQPTLNVPSASYPTIQIAISLAQPGSTVIVAPGTYNTSLNFMGKAITVRSSQGAEATILSGTFSGRVVTFSTNEGVNSVLDGFTVRGGNGGVLIQNASPTIQNCNIFNNAAVATTGGGIRMSALTNGTASPLITDCSIKWNTGIHGGGVHCSAESGSTSNPTVARCKIESNFASAANGLGGGVFVDGAGSSAASFVDCDITDNIAGGDGGGVRISPNSNSATIAGCKISRNRATSAGGIAAYGSAGIVTVTASLISDNLAAGDVGGGSFTCPNSSISFCTIAGNRALGLTGINGGFVFNPPSCQGSSVATISHSVFWGNSLVDLQAPSSNCAGPIIFTAMNVTFSALGVVLGTFTGAPIYSDPLFVDAANGDYHLSASSPCRDAGAPIPMGLPLTDIDGTARLVGPAVDLGADEVPLAALPGTNEDLDFFIWVDGGGDPERSVFNPGAGNLVRIGFASRGGTFAGAPPLMLAQAFSSGFPPASVSGHPSIHIDVLTPFGVVFGAIVAAPFPAPGLPSVGVSFETQVPPGFLGVTVRIQGFVLTPLAANGIYAATAARDIILP